MQKQEKEITRDDKNKLTERSAENRKILTDFGLIVELFWVAKSMQKHIETCDCIEREARYSFGRKLKHYLLEDVSFDGCPMRNP